MKYYLLTLLKPFIINSTAIIEKMELSKQLFKIYLCIITMVSENLKNNKLKIEN